MIWLATQKTPERCPRCARQISVFDSSSGEFVCGNCGFVLKEKTEEVGYEWRAFSPEERDQKSHTGAPSTLSKHDMGLSTVIGYEFKDATGKTLPSATKSAIYRMRTWDQRSMVHNSSDRNLSIALSELSRIADKLNVSDFVVEHAAYTYRKALERGLVRGRSILGIISASLYEACRNTNTPRTLKDVAPIVDMKKKDLAKHYRLLVRELGLMIPVMDPVKCVSRIASRVGLSERTQRKAFEILNTVRESKTSAGKDPMGLAASALYLASTMAGEENHTVTQKDIAEAAGVTEVTIRNRIKGLKHLWSLK
jgi:transcription initiation factor TFIIB